MIKLNDKLTVLDQLLLQQHSIAYVFYSAVSIFNELRTNNTGYGKSMLQREKKKTNNFETPLTLRSYIGSRLTRLYSVHLYSNIARKDQIVYEQRYFSRLLDIFVLDAFGNRHNGKQYHYTVDVPLMSIFRVIHSYEVRQ